MNIVSKSLLVISCTLRVKTFAGIILSRFSLFSVIFAKVSTFGNSKSSKHESFPTRNHGYFLKRETRKFF